LHVTHQRVEPPAPAGPGFTTRSQAHRSFRPYHVRLLRTGYSSPVAFHPTSRWRSYSRLQAGERMPGEDFHLSDWAPSRAHERRHPAGGWVGAEPLEPAWSRRSQGSCTAQEAVEPTYWSQRARRNVTDAAKLFRPRFGYGPAISARPQQPRRKV